MMLADPTDTTIDDIALRNSETDDDSLLASLTEQEWADIGCLDRPVALPRRFHSKFHKVEKKHLRLTNLSTTLHLIADLESDDALRLEIRYDAERLRQAATRLNDWMHNWGHISVTQDAILAVAYDIDRRFKEYAS